MSNLRCCIRGLWVLSLCLAAGLARADAWPSRPVRFVVPFPAGGPTDIITRALAQRLADALGQPVLVDNKPGAGGVIGSEFAARSAPDGYTMVMGTSSTHSIGPALNPKLGYDVERDFAAVSHIANSPMVLVVSPQLPANNVRELIALAKASPGRLNYASSGVGTIVHLAGELFCNSAGVVVVHVPYKGVGLAIPDIVSGQVSMMFDNLVTALPQIRSGKVKGIAVAGSRRTSLAPDLPTVSESGLPGFDVDAYFGVFVPAGTPREIVSRLSGEFARIVNAPAMKEQLARFGTEPIGSSPEQFASVVRAENAKWTRLIRSVGIRME